VANQNSDQVVIFKIDKETGLLTDTGNRIDVGKPVCLKWLSVTGKPVKPEPAPPVRRY
jgi:6-phosphogluconolactonase